MLPSMLRAAQIVNRSHGLRAVIAGVQGSYDYERAIAPFTDCGISIDYDNARKVIANSTVVLTASGTATLEAGIIGRVMVIVYKTGLVTYQIARRLVKLNDIGLVNLALGERVVPELIQDRATATAMAAEVQRFLNDEVYAQSVLHKLSRLPPLLGDRGASARAATLVNEYL